MAPRGDSSEGPAENSVGLTQDASSEGRRSECGSAPCGYPCSFEAAADLPLDALPYLPQGTLREVRVLSEALYGEVSLVERGPLQAPTSRFVVKRMPRAKVLRGGLGIESARNEIHAALALTAWELPCTVEVLGAAQDDEYFYLAMEHCDRGELFAVLEQHGRFTSEAVLREVIGQVLLALRGLHAAGAAHRDVSLENVLVAEDGTVRLCDFGQAILVHPPGRPSEEARVKPSVSGLPGKLPYRAPEIDEGCEYSAKALDVFACGVLLYTLAVGGYPFNGSASRCPRLFPHEQRNEGRCAQLGRELGSAGALAQVSPALLDLLEQMLAPCPAKRITAEEALTHPWLVGTLDDLWLELEAGGAPAEAVEAPGSHQDPHVKAANFDDDDDDRSTDDLSTVEPGSDAGDDGVYDATFDGGSSCC